MRKFVTKINVININNLVPFYLRRIKSETPMIVMNATDTLLKVPVSLNAADLLTFVSAYDYFRSKFLMDCYYCFNEYRSVCMYVGFKTLFYVVRHLDCLLSSHWRSFRLLSFMAFFISSIQFFFGLPRAQFCFDIHFSAILSNLPSAILWI